MNACLAVILGGGRGSRLFPLTRQRSKPAVPIGGKYRLIDIPVSNCLNSDLRRIFVLTQYNSESLNKHLTMTYKFDIFSSAFVTVLAAEQTDESPHWFQGTADAVRQSLWHFRSHRSRELLVLSGDQLLNGIISMNRTSQGRSSVSAARGTTSSSLKPRTTTLLSLIGVSPTASAAARPARTLSTWPPRVMRENFCGSSVSRLMFTRCSPADARGAASSFRSTPFVVIATSSMPGIAAI